MTTIHVHLHDLKRKRKTRDAYESWSLAQLEAQAHAGRAGSSNPLPASILAKMLKEISERKAAGKK